ncbi:GspH/FimT family pseudopilin [Glaciimonas sp. PCH181]|uniref:GspH/FimT family pseudopilin n=1 Tax=Glaciimonas sp. PCH181 TaxID=2133943 RepID=UPI000D3D0AAE|nr:GspH/FimT family pseudopilin [Glaciimonas sp. PCH181]PUA16966.1 hypothetical protein C7W93_13415 [Glaciimonas sp. PCH181]
MLHSTFYIKRLPVFTAIVPRTGFTLIEILITMSIMSILLAIGLPSMRDFIVKTRLNGNVNQFITAAMLARTEAIKRGRSVVLCPSVNAEFDQTAGCIATAMSTVTGGGPSRDGYEWSKGWIVVVPKAKDDKPVLLRQAALGHNTIVNGGRREIKYDGMGRPGASFTSLLFRDGEFDRTVCISASGRMRITKGTAC